MDETETSRQPLLLIVIGRRNVFHISLQQLKVARMGSLVSLEASVVGMRFITDPKLSEWEFHIYAASETAAQELEESIWKKDLRSISCDGVVLGLVALNQERWETCRVPDAKVRRLARSKGVELRRLEPEEDESRSYRVKRKRCF